MKTVEPTGVWVAVYCLGEGGFMTRPVVIWSRELGARVPVGYVPTDTEDMRLVQNMPDYALTAAVEYGGFLCFAPKDKANDVIDEHRNKYMAPRCNKLTQCCFDEDRLAAHGERIRNAKVG
jgi:hypothetical protein